jgi:ribosomal protein S18 acetylase RimI-like enzyme
MSDSKMLIRPMRRKELDLLVDWAAQEGWNPGLRDADVFWATDQNAFIAAEFNGRLIGGGSIAAYGKHYGFMGFFIIHPDFRGRGLGNTLWHERLRRLRSRLEPGATIGMDGVFDMQDYYARGGFKLSHRDMRFEGLTQPGSRAPGIVPLSEVSFETVDAYDRVHFPAPRTAFLKRWITTAGMYCKGAVDGDKLTGYGVVRACRKGFKIGPLFADTPGIAQNLLDSLCARVPGETVFLDVPENNPAALKLAKKAGMKEVFGCAKMYFGPTPRLPDEEIFGVTTFEFG